MSRRYENVEVVFLAHDIQAKEVSEEEFFTKGEAGGTFMSDLPDEFEIDTPIGKIPSFVCSRYRANLPDRVGLCFFGGFWGLRKATIRSLRA